MANAICTFRVQLIDERSFTVTERVSYSSWNAERNRLHYMIPARYTELGGVWQDTRFHPMHRIALIELQATEQADK